jgi:cysteine desulfurase family protein (TIGR01976 family)
MDFDVDAFRAQFPALAEGAAHFDGPGGSQTPLAVADAVHRTMTAAVSNRGASTPAERRAEHVVHEARAAMGDLLGSDPRGIVFGRSMTALTYELSRTLARSWGPGDEVVVTRLDHDANIRPWVQAAASVGARVRWADFDPETGELTAADVAAVLSERTRLVAVTAASNLIGTRPPIADIADAAHDAGAGLYVDGVHATAHTFVDARAAGADVWACSPYKFLGPHCGVLSADPEWLESLHPDKLLPSTDEVPERFELGTLPYELLAGTTAAVDVLAGLAPEGGSRRERLRVGWGLLDEHESRLRRWLEDALDELPGVRRYSRAAHRTPTVLFTLDGTDTQDVSLALARRGVNAPAGSFYAIECSRHLGLGDSGGVRAGLALYTNEEDVTRLVAGVRDLAHRPVATAPGRGTAD